MQARTLHKILGQMIEQGHGYKTVKVSKETFKHPCESDGLTLLDIEKAEVQKCFFMDENGCCIWPDGNEHYRTWVVLSGE